MINKKPNIDEAWKSLYSKLQEDDLLTCKEPAHRRKIMNYYQWVAACVAILLLIFIPFYYFSNKHVDLLTLTNKNSDNFLVKTLDDGSTVYLASNGSLDYPKSFSKTERLVILHGEALFDVTKNSSKPFLIETERVTVKVLGTAFKVKSYNHNHFELAVQRGVVRVTEKTNGTALNISAGQSVMFINDKLYKFKTRNDNLFDLYKSNMRFKDERLDNIVRVINLNNKSCIILKGEQLKARKLNVEFYKNDIDEMTQIISLALNLKREVRKDTVYISQN